MAIGYVELFGIVSLICCACCLLKQPFWTKVAFGLSIAILAATYYIVCVWYGHSYNTLTMLQSLLLFAYGAALIFSSVEDYVVYRKKEKSAKKKARLKANKPLFQRVLTWMALTIVCIFITIPIFFRMYNEMANAWAMLIVGFIVSIVGFFMLYGSKNQIRNQAIVHDMVPMTGMFALCRFPHLLGEIIFWLGIFLSAVDCYANTMQWAMALIGLICIVCLVIYEANLLDKQQERRYGRKDEYQAYVAKTSILIPFLPIHHLGNYQD